MELFNYKPKLNFTHFFFQKTKSFIIFNIYFQDSSVDKISSTNNRIHFDLFMRSSIIQPPPPSISVSCHGHEKKTYAWNIASIRAVSDRKFENKSFLQFWTLLITPDQPCLTFST